MAQYPDGLNCLPLLGRHISPPSSSRSRLSLTKKVSHKSLFSYNGNYEGDTSMFTEKGMLELENLNLLEDTTDDSGTELDKDLAIYKDSERVVKSARMVMQEFQAWRLIHFCMMRFLRPEMVMKITQGVENVYDSTINGRTRRVMLFIKPVFLWIFQVLMSIACKIGRRSSVLWKSRTFIRNATKRLLWSMTLAKCGDQWLFALILFCTPWLFLLAIMGFVISLYCSLKESIQRSWVFLRSRVF